MGPKELTLTAGSLKAQEGWPVRWSSQFPKRQRWLPAPSEPVWLSLGTAAQGWGLSGPEEPIDGFHSQCRVHGAEVGRARGCFQTSDVRVLSSTTGEPGQLHSCATGDCPHADPRPPDLSQDLLPWGRLTRKPATQTPLPASRGETLPASLSLRSHRQLLPE